VKVSYDPDVDVLRILLSPVAIEESDQDKPGLIFDYDVSGHVVGIEILNFRTGGVESCAIAAQYRAGSVRPPESRRVAGRGLPSLSSCHMDNKDSSRFLSVIFLGKDMVMV
jgi:uncharacterized protein YuzE